MKLPSLLLANVLTLARLLLGLALPWLPHETRLAAVAFAGLSDLVDGALSRWMGATSYFGRVLDPIADKVFVLALLGVLIAEGTLSVPQALLIGLRDLAVLFGAAVGAGFRRWELFRRLAPTLLGKLTTVAQFLFLLLLLVPGQPGRPVVFVLTAGLSGAAAVDYLRRFAALFAEGPQSSTSS